MLNFKYIRDKKTKEEWIETSLTGKPLLNIPQLNKGTAFTEDERLAFELLGKLPPQVETLEEQAQRAYKQYQSYETQLQKNIYLNNLHDKNQVLFYKLVSDHLREIMPTIYTPIVGTAVKQFSREFRQPRGLYIAYPYRDYIDQILDNRSNPEIDLIVVTDGEGVLGIGDQGVGAMDIPIAKLMVYTLCGGINPNRTLPIQLDVGTNNQTLLDDPFYLGWRHKRLSGPEYHKFVEDFVAAVKRKFPQVFLHWEDFGRENARLHLDKFGNQLCTFNDDIQGTGTVTLAAILAAVKANKSTLAEQRIVIFGAGNAGTGIADQICAAMVRQGLTVEEARSRFWLIDKQGLLIDTMKDLTPAQHPYARPYHENAWIQSNQPKDLAAIVKHVHPTILIGCSARPGAFTKEIIQEMASHVSRPIILPLSNPTEYCEAHPANILQWTKSNVLLATGSPFDDVIINGKSIRIPQCNNALVFPGVGLGVTAIKAKRVTEEMLWAACQTLSECASIHRDPQGAILPFLEDARDIAKKIAITVAITAEKQSLVTNPTSESIDQAVEHIIWSPHYCKLRKA